MALKTVLGGMAGRSGDAKKNSGRGRSFYPAKHAGPVSVAARGGTPDESPPVLVGWR